MSDDALRAALAEAQVLLNRKLADGGEDRFTEPPRKFAALVATEYDRLGGAS